MTISQTGVVDWLGIEAVTGHVSLTVIDDLDWINEQDHLLLLQEKLNTYLAFIESGEVFERLATDAGRQVSAAVPVVVSILAKYGPTDRAQEFIDHAVRVFDRAGFTLKHKLIRE